MRIGIIGLIQECNTFLPQLTTIEKFKEDRYYRGAEVLDRQRGSLHETGGFIAAVEEAGYEPVGVFMGAAVPAGVIEEAAERELLDTLLEELGKAGHLDGLLVAPHGAAVGQTHPDFDGYWLGEVRKRIGSLPMISTLDPHANLTPAMVGNTDAIVAYRSNPHIDQQARGMEAGRLLVRTLRGEVKPTTAAAFPPVAMNIERQCTEQSPCLELYAVANAQLKQPGVLTNSVLLGFPYADVAEMGSAFVVTTDNDPALAQRLADDLAAYLVEHREDFAGHFISVDEAVAEAMSSQGPFCLLDMGDNVGGGSPGDGTLLPHALAKALRASPGKRAHAMITDPEAVRQAKAAGEGGQVELSIGGKSGPLHGEPLTSKVTVLRLYDGRFEETQIRHGGRKSFDMGDTAVVQTPEGLVLTLTTRRTAPFSLGAMTSGGLDPATFDIMVAKGVNAPVAAYRDVARRFIRVNTSGVTCADMTQLPFSRRRKPLFPFER